MTRFLVSTTGPQAWQGLLTKPELWKPGRSAHALAHTWEAASGFPPAVEATLHNGAPGVANAEIMLGLPEWKVDLPPPGGRPSQTDLMLIAQTQSRSRVVIAVEGKVDEPFGDPVSVWRATDPSPGKEERPDFLLRLLELEGVNPDGLRYQLLHRTGSALIEATRFGADAAVVLVHSFSPEHYGWPDFGAFLEALDVVHSERGQTVEVPRANAPQLLLGWVPDHAPASDDQDG